MSNLQPRTEARYRGVFPVVPTPFNADGTLDLEGQKRVLDFMIDAGSNGLCILANFSEQFVLADDERETLTRTILEHVAGRVPVIVTTTHFSTDICLARGQRAQAQLAHDERVRAALACRCGHRFQCECRGTAAPRQPTRKSKSQPSSACSTCST